MLCAIPSQQCLLVMCRLVRVREFSSHMNITSSRSVVDPTRVGSNRLSLLVLLAMINIHPNISLSVSPYPSPSFFPLSLFPSFSLSSGEGDSKVWSSGGLLSRQRELAWSPGSHQGQEVCSGSLVHP